MKPDTRENASFEELDQDAKRHWQNIGKIRDERYPVVQQMLKRPWRCPQCRWENESGGVCVRCREARLIEVE